MFKDDDFVAYEVSTTMEMAEQFRDIYGMRFVGLADGLNQLYGTYSYPDAEAPFPKDVVIDRSGIIRYWSTEYNPQKLKEVIQQLLDETTSTEEPGPWAGTTIRVNPAFPNPSHNDVSVSWSSPHGGWSVEIFDVAGRTVLNLGTYGEAGDHSVRWNGRDRSGRQTPAGVYFVNLRNGEDVASQRLMRID